MVVRMIPDGCLTRWYLRPARKHFSNINKEVKKSNAVI